MARKPKKKIVINFGAADKTAFDGFDFDETPIGNLANGGIESAQLRKNKLTVDLDTSALVGTPEVRLIATVTKSKSGEIVIGTFQLKADGTLVAEGDMNGFNTGAKKPGQFDFTSFDFWTGGKCQFEIDGNNGANLVFGTDNDDAVNGRGGNDTCWGFEGNDRFDGGSGNDGFSGATGNDWFSGRAGHDLAIAGKGRDIVKGGADHDFIDLGDGKGDFADGGSGNDIILAGRGTNTVKGGTGADLFGFASGDVNVGDGRTVVRDFDPSADMLVFYDLDSRPNAATGGATTLADLTSGDIPGVSWEVQGDDLVITVGSHVVTLNGTSPADIRLDRLFFSTRFDAGEVVTSGVFGEAILGNGEESDPAFTLSGGNLITQNDTNGIGVSFQLPDGTEIEIIPSVDQGLLSQAYMFYD